MRKLIAKKAPTLVNSGTWAIAFQQPARGRFGRFTTIIYGWVSYRFYPRTSLDLATAVWGLMGKKGFVFRLKGVQLSSLECNGE